MTFGFGSRAAPEVSDEVLENQDAEDCLLPMGITSENVAADYNISRSYQDAFSAKSFQKAAAANKAGKFKDEIVPINAKWIDPKTEEVKEVLVNEDDGIREGVTAESLAKIKPAFKKDGVTHAGTFPLPPVHVHVSPPSGRQRISSLRWRSSRRPRSSLRCKTP